MNAAPALFDMGEVVQRSGARMRLRTLLADKRWHTTAEVLHVAGSGVSSRIAEIRRGADRMPALDIVCERVRAGRYRYRVTGETIAGANLDGEAAVAQDLARECPPLAMRAPDPEACGICPDPCPVPGEVAP